MADFLGRWRRFAAALAPRRKRNLFPLFRSENDGLTGAHRCRRFIRSDASGAVSDARPLHRRTRVRRLRRRPALRHQRHGARPAGVATCHHGELARGKGRTMITAGTRLGPYEVLSPLGAGGMGEVWKARDTRLDRSVAIKVLPAEFAENAQLKTRFEREAKTISQLNHPHICTLYDVGDNYLVMELLEGETLADKLAKGPLPITEVLRIGSQIA